MRTHKIFALIMVMLMVLSSMSLTFAGIQKPGNDMNDGSLAGYSEFTGSLNTVVIEGKYWVKDDSPNPGAVKVLNLGNGYQIELTYDSSDNFVEWELIEPIDPDYTITIDWINVKGGNFYMHYSGGYDTTEGNTLYTAQNGAFGVSHVTVGYQFVEIQTPPPPVEKGTLTIHKEVWIDEVEDVDNDIEFTFTVNGETVKASAIQSGQIELEVGTYIVTEFDFGDFEPELETQEVIITTAGEDLTFVNSMETDTDPEKGTLTIYKEVWINGELEENDETEFYFKVMLKGEENEENFETVTATASQSGTIELEVGTYIVTEFDFGDFEPELETQEVIITTAGEDLTFVNSMETDTPPPPPPPPVETGTLTIYKQVEIDGVIDVDNDTEFTFTVNGETVKASAIQSGQIELEVGTYTVTETDFGDFTPVTLTQEAIVTTDGAELTFVNTMETDTPPPPPPPTTSSTTYSMSITKTADETTVEVGDTITYTITLTNTGNGTLTNVRVEDEMVGLDEIVPTLAPGASVTFTETFEPQETGTLVNTATATDNQAPFVQDDATVTVIESTIEETDDTVETEEVIDEEVPLDVPEVEIEEEITPEPEEEIVIMEEETPLAIPDTGVNTPAFAYGAGALISLLALLKKKR
ncbi:MAG: DUF11 domain-containing protein [Dethiosulfatibacter sp.]|nr:DUF11 domain-containing protein [Dethiosulfatibacter sp.]